MKDGKYVILCIDDDEDLLGSLRVILERNGYLVQTASTSVAGMQCYQTAKPDLLIVDLMMESADSGIALVKKINALGAAPPIYLLSSAGDALMINADYNDLGLSSVLQKPIIPEVLLSSVRSQLTKP